MESDTDHERLGQAVRRNMCVLMDTIDPKDIIGRLYQVFSTYWI